MPSRLSLSFLYGSRFTVSFYLIYSFENRRLLLVSLHSSRRFLFNIEPQLVGNQTLLFYSPTVEKVQQESYSAVPVPLLGDARPVGWVTFCSICASILYNAENPKHDRKRFISIKKTIRFSYLHIIYLCLPPSLHILFATPSVFICLTCLHLYI